MSAEWMRQRIFMPARKRTKKYFLRLFIDESIFTQDFKGDLEATMRILWAIKKTHFENTGMLDGCEITIPVDQWSGPSKFNECLIGGPKVNLATKDVQSFLRDRYLLAPTLVRKQGAWEIRAPSTENRSFDSFSRDTHLDYGLLVVGPFVPPWDGLQLIVAGVSSLGTYAAARLATVDSLLNSIEKELEQEGRAKHCLKNHEAFWAICKAERAKKDGSITSSLVRVGPLQERP